MVWLKFIACILMIFFGGRAVARYADVISRRTGLGQAWIGVVLVAAVTSLPELFTGISAVAVVGKPALTLGNLLGANTFNLLNLALLDMVYGQRSIFRGISVSHRFTAWYSLALLATVVFFILFSWNIHPLALGWVGLYTPAIIALYLYSVRRLLGHERRERASRQAGSVPEPEIDALPMRRVYASFVVAALVVIGAGVWLAIVGDEVARVTGWGEGFVGSLFLAFTTTLPEITVSFSALRLGAVDLAVANMLGSNLFNLSVIAIDDVFYANGPILASASFANLLTAAVVAAMTVVFLAGLGRPPRKRSGLSWFNCTLVVLFLVGAYLSYAPPA
ncbi:MAG: sodium:calcium antiporter [Chloroflexota bacterium]